MLCLVAPAAPNARVEDPVDREAKVKAMFIYHFAKFTEWPAEALPAGAPLVVCVDRGDSVYQALDETLAKKVAGGHVVHFSLTVEEGQEFSDAGGMVQLFVENSRAAFCVSGGAAERNHLKVNSKMLSLARVRDAGKRGRD